MPADWIQTFTRKRFHILDPRIEEIDVVDIAHALSRICRFTGQVEPAYTVGEHSVRVSDLLREWGESPQVQLSGLLHDASEAYIADVSRPLKRTDQMVGYREVEARLEEAICRKFDTTIGATVKKADDAMLYVEARDLLSGGPLDGWAKEPERIPCGSVEPWGVGDAVEVRFLRRFLELTR